jgi:hypothetical protein
LKHPESSVAKQKTFLHDLKALLSLVKEGAIVNSFKETGPELVTLDTDVIMDFEVLKGLKEAPNIFENTYSQNLYKKRYVG